jgi:predicted phage-related endonuclease
MSNNENASQAESDTSPDVEPDHVEGAPTADNPPATAGPNDSFLDEKSKHRLRVQQLKLDLVHKEAENFCKQTALEKRLLVGYEDTVATQHNRISKLEADQKATETQLKAKLRSAQLGTKENIRSLLAPVSGCKNETAKAKRDLLDSTKSLGKALKTGAGSDKKVKALELAKAHLQNDLSVTHSKLKDVSKEINKNRQQLDNQLDAKHQLRLSLAKIDLRKQKVSLSREQEKKRKRDDIHQPYRKCCSRGIIKKSKGDGCES